MTKITPKRIDTKSDSSQRRWPAKGAPEEIGGVSNIPILLSVLVCVTTPIREAGVSTSRTMGLERHNQRCWAARWCQDREGRDAQSTHASCRLSQFDYNACSAALPTVHASTSAALLAAMILRPADIFHRASSRTADRSRNAGVLVWD